MRKTKASSAILDALRKKGQALTHKDIQEEVGALCDRVTTYRVLGRLTDEGLVHRVADPEGVVRYAACSSCDSGHAHSHEHLHFTCLKCGSTTCLEEVNVNFVLPKGYTLSESNFAVTGICDRCTSAV